MRVLMVTTTPPHLPTHERARVAPAALLKHLASHHAMSVVAPEASGQTPAQRAWPTALGVRTIRVPGERLRRPFGSGAPAGLPALAEAVRRLIATWAPDVVHLDGVLLAPLAAEVSVPTLLSCGESGVRRAREARGHARTPRAWVRAQLDERLEADWARRWLPAAARCVVPTEADRLTLAEHVPSDRIDVVPPGIDTALYAPRRGGERGRLVFVGALDRPSHLEAARRLASRVLPRVRADVPHAELVIAGGGPSPALRALAALPGVRVTGAAPDLRPTLWSAAVALVPAEAGPGADAALLEAMALGTPVVSAHCCLSGFEHVLADQHVLVAEDDAETAAAATRLLREPVVAATLAVHARHLVERRYTWASVARSYESLWDRVTTPRPVAVAA